MSDPAVNREFLNRAISELGSDYAKETGASKVAIEIMLKGGGTIRIEGSPRLMEDAVLLDFKSGSQLRRMILPYASILGVAFAPDESTGRVGFR